jgi:peptide/nickel transport system ATP-binding protein
MDQSLLSLEDLCISFPSDRTRVNTVDQVSFNVYGQDFLGIVGESGSGKTLTALSIIRLLPANALSSGIINFKGVDLMTRSDKNMQEIRGNEISMIFQEPMTSLNPVFTVGKQIAEVLTRHRDISRKEALDSTVELLRSSVEWRDETAGHDSHGYSVRSFSPYRRRTDNGPGCHNSGSDTGTSRPPEDG